MLQLLTNANAIKEAERRIRQLIDDRAEWFYAEKTNTIAAALRRNECDLRVAHGRLIFSCWANEGARSWRIVGWEWTGEKLLLEATRRMGAERTVLELIPRASASAIVASMSATRRALCERLARLACERLDDAAKIERMSLSAGARRGQPGRHARILLRTNQGHVAVTGPVALSESGDIDAFLSSALIWFTRTRERVRGPTMQKLWLVVQTQGVEQAQRQVALLRDDLRRIITLYAIDDGWQDLTPVPSLERAELWTGELPRFPVAVEKRPSEWASRIVALEPKAIDVVRARYGETLRFHGLPFARVRRVMNSERVWFGVEGKRRRLLDENSLPEWTSLIEELKEHRRAETLDHQHAFYKALPEAWLESLLRRDITRLDPGLIIAPLHAQFRTSHPGHTGSRPVDLLALRRDGRLVVIEIKVSEDREHVLQGADYWRRVEAHRLHGHIARAQLFGNAAIQDSTPLVYLVAPLLRFHRAFHTLAQSIAPELEIYRFDINEDWRDGVRTVRRARAN